MLYKDIGSSAVITLSDFKAFANIVSSEQDVRLEAILKEAALRVAEYADMAMLPVTILLEGEGDEVKLYQHPVTEVVSVEDKNGGVSLIDSSVVEDDLIRLPYECRYKVEYTSTPLAANVARYLTCIYEMASAIYDGNTDEQTKVYNRIP